MYLLGLIRKLEIILGILSRELYWELSVYNNIEEEIVRGSCYWFLGLYCFYGFVN